MTTKTESKIYFVCDECGIEEPPNFELTKKISDDNLEAEDIPFHCSIKMRITILEKPVLEKISIDTRSTLWSIIETSKVYFQKIYGTIDKGIHFEKIYESLLTEFDHDLPEIMIHKIKENLEPAIQQGIEKKVDQDVIRRLASGIIHNVVEGAKKRMAATKNPIERSGPVLPGSQKTHTVDFVCSVCQEIIEVDPEVKNTILETDTEIDLPLHHDQPVQIKITHHRSEKPVEPKPPSNKYDFFSASQVEEMDITSVGIDIGSSTSHLIFSKLSLRREVGFMNMTNRFNIIGREILFESDIINTPLLNPTSIDIEQVVQFCKTQYQKAGYKPENIDTGAVIVTGETAKKENAAEIVNRLSDEAGKFVSAVAGPNLESMLGAMGSGAAARSQQEQNVVLNVDIGGGTSNLAIVVNGRVVDTSCINVGGRLLGIDDNFKIWRIDQPTEILMEELGLTYQIGDIISEIDAKKIAETYAFALIEVMKGSATSKIAKTLMMTSDMNFSLYNIDEILFSGGVAEMIYGEPDEYNDIGVYIAQYIKNYDFGIPIIEPTSKIRATVIGTGSYSLAISGSTIFYDKQIEFPLTNIPALTIDVRKEDFHRDRVISEIRKAFDKYDIREGEEIVALYFIDPIYARDMFLPDFVTAIEASLPNSIINNQLIILVFKTDVGGTIGMALRNETAIKNNFMCLDEIELQEGDWIDIGAPLGKGDVFPITVKSLVFN